MSDELAETMYAPAAALVCAVADRDAETVAEVIADMSAKDLRALAVVLASMIDPDAHRTTTGPELLALSLSEAMRQAAELFCVDPEEMLSTSRRREATDARAVACYVGFLLGMTYSGIGREIGRDHTTVIYACNRVAMRPYLRVPAEKIAAGLGWVKIGEFMETVA